MEFLLLVSRKRSLRQLDVSELGQSGLSSQPWVLRQNSDGLQFSQTSDMTQVDGLAVDFYQVVIGAGKGVVKAVLLPEARIKNAIGPTVLPRGGDGDNWIGGMLAPI